MPSPRRVRALVLSIILSLGVTFYLTSGLRNSDGSSFYKQTVNAMSSKEHAGHLQDSSSVNDGQGVLPEAGKEQDTFRKLQPSASEQDKQAIAPERQFEVEREKKKKEQEREREKLKEKGKEQETEKAKAKTDGKSEADEDGYGEGGEGVAMYKGKIDATEKTDKADDDASETTSHKATKGDKSATSSKGKDEQTNDGEKEKGKPKNLDKVSDEVGEGSETKTTKGGNDPEIETEFQSILKRSPVIVFSKSYCPFSKKAKHILSKYTIVPAPHIVELDEHPLGGRLQAMIGKITGRATVPNILINGKSLGGGDDVEALHQKGTLAQSIRDMAGKRVVQVSSKAKRSAVDDNTDTL